jgi:uncharacterized membrane protein YedE/YeeE
MFHVLPHRLPWWLAGPGIGLCVVALFAIGNMRLGVSGAWLQVLSLTRRERPSEPWRLWFLGGLVGGVLVAALLGTIHLHGYGALGSEVPAWALVPLLLAGGVAIGFGARRAGGCTSGHGISGCSARSPASFVTTAVFFGVAVVVTLAVHAVTGGRV